MRRKVRSRSYRCLVAGFLAIGAMPQEPASAQTMDQLVDQCANDNPNHMFAWDVALASCTKVIQSGRWSGRNLAWAYIDRCQAYDRQGQYDRAIPDCDRGIRLDPNDSNGFLNRGIAYRNTKQFDRARADFNEALRLNPRDAKVYNSRGYLYLDEKDYDTAIADFDQAIRLAPRLAAAYYGRGLAKDGRGDSTAGEADVARAKELDPNIVR